MTFDYKEYAFDNLRNWLHDCIGNPDVSSKELFDVIKEVVVEEREYYTKGASRTNELLELLTKNNNVIDFSNISVGISTPADSVYQRHIDPGGNDLYDVKYIYHCGVGDTSEYCKSSWNNFWEETYYPEEYKKQTHDEMIAAGYSMSGEGFWMSPENNKVKKWVLPVEEVQNAENHQYEYFVVFPDDLLEAADLKEGDQVEWIDQGDGSYLIKKVERKET